MKNKFSFDEIYTNIEAHKVPFFLTFFAVITVSYLVLYIVDFYPEPVTEEAEVAAEEVEVPAEVVTTPVEVITEPEPVVSVNDPYPVSIYFDSLDKEIPVLNPGSPEYSVLDEALLSGAVRHPQSADLTEDGNIFILAHSSYLPNVLNKHFQAFNDIQKLNWGDTIRLRSNEMEYVYRVEKVYEDKASDIFVPFTPGEARLTLATCNVLGAKEDRFMVEAKLISSTKI